MTLTLCKHYVYRYLMGTLHPFRYHQRLLQYLRSLLAFSSPLRLYVVFVAYHSQIIIIIFFIFTYISGQGLVITSFLESSD